MIAIVIGVAILLFLMYGSVGKSVKKYMPEEDMPKPVDTPWDFGKPFSYDDDIVDEEEVATEAVMQQLAVSAPTYDSKPELMHVVHLHEENLNKESKAGNSIADKFDLETAVIYSEILKPKFNEY